MGKIKRPPHTHTPFWISTRTKRPSGEPKRNFSFQDVTCVLGLLPGRVCRPERRPQLPPPVSSPRALERLPRTGPCLWASPTLLRPPRPAPRSRLPASTGLRDSWPPTQNSFLLRLEAAAEAAAPPSPRAAFPMEIGRTLALLSACSLGLGEAGPEGPPDLQATGRRQQDSLWTLHLQVTVRGSHPI